MSAGDRHKNGKPKDIVRHIWSREDKPAYETVIGGKRSVKIPAQLQTL